ncbi:MAG: Uma2 family endonuclease [Chloroflexi bacterium]|nr:Uma2 family endonuclease [Chloroflexota bacterium]
MALPAQQHRWTPQEYLAFERAAETRHEFVDGEVFDMAGASRAHQKIAGNLFAGLHVRLRGRDCGAYMTDMRVQVEDWHYTYPDVIAVCGEEHIEDVQHMDTLLNPTVIIEVLSPTTEQYDRGEKFRRYRGIESLQEYVLVAQDRPMIERFTRQTDGTWQFVALEGLDAEMRLESIGCALPLADVYEKVFPEA